MVDSGIQQSDSVTHIHMERKAHPRILCFMCQFTFP